MMTSALADHWLVAAVGWAILHSLWQGAAIGVATALALRALARASANRRYAVACLGLAALAAAWAGTAVIHVDVTGPARIAGGAASHMMPALVTASRPFSSSVTGAIATYPAAPVSWRGTIDSWSAIIVVVWLIGVCLMSARLVYGWLQVQRVRKATDPVADALQLRALALARRLRVSRPVQIAQSAAVHVPTVAGWLRPVVLLPVSALAGLSPSQLDAILAHELAHVRRHDYFINIVQTGIEVVLFYHPACWWISRQIRHERELCCDDVAVAVCGDRVAYATALTEMETLRADQPALGLAATDGPLLQRVRRLVSAPAAMGGAAPSWAAAALPLVVLSVAMMSAQTRVPTPAQVIPGDQGVIRGQVLDDQSGRPIAGASVELGADDPGITVRTAEDGRYEASGLRPGLYHVHVRAAGYIDRFYGGRDANDIGVLLDVRGGQAVSAIDVRLISAGAVSGRVLDEHGAVLPGVELELVADRALPNGLGLPGVAFAQSEADGAYRFPQVTPGEYRVRAYVDSGRRPEGRPGLVYGTTYFPGVDLPEAAQPLRVSGGQDVVGIDFSLRVERTHRVAGRLIDANGESPRGVRIQMHSMRPGGARHEFEAAADADGRFAIGDVPRGTYILMAADTRVTSRWTYASGVVTVEDADLTDLEIRARVGAMIEGHVVKDDGVARSLDPSGVRVVFQRQLEGPVGFFSGGGRPAAADGTFSYQTPAGPNTIGVSDLPRGWMVRRILVDGVEIADAPIDLGENAHRRVDVVLTTRVTHLLGTVTDRDGRPVPGASVLAFPDGPAPEWMPGSRTVRQTQTTQDGRFDIDALPPGAYLAVAVARPAPFAFEDPDLLQRLSRDSTRVHIDDGGQQSLSLRVVQGAAQAASAARRVVVRKITEIVQAPAGPRARLSGTVIDPRGRGVAGAWVLLFSGDAPSWKKKAASVRQVRADDSGRFAIDKLETGAYFVVATKSPEYALKDQRLLQNLGAFGRRVQIGEGEPRTLSLLILPPPPPPPPPPLSQRGSKQLE